MAILYYRTVAGEKSPELPGSTAFVFDFHVPMEELYTGEFGSSLWVEFRD